MEHSICVKKIFATARTEYVKWVCNPRMVMLVVLFCYIHGTVITPLLEHAEKMQSPLNILEPFIAAVNSEAMIIVVPALFLALFSDFPRTDGNTLFFLQRVGRLNWVIGQAAFAVMAVFSYLTVVCLMCVLPVMEKGFWANGWSLVVTEYGREYPEEAQSFACLILKGNIYNQMPPFQAALWGSVLMFAYLLMIAFLMLLCNAKKNKVLGILVVSAVIGFGTTMFIQNMPQMWLFPMAHSCLIAHFSTFFSKTKMSFGYSVLYLCGGILLLFFLSMGAMKRMNFESLQEID